MAIDLHRIGRGIHGKLLPLVVLLHGPKQSAADPPAVICRPDKEAADVLRLAHTQRPHQFIAVKCAIKPQRPDTLRVMQTGAKKVNALLRILRGFKLLKNLPRQLQSSRDFFAAQAADGKSDWLFALCFSFENEYVMISLFSIYDDIIPDIFMMK